MITVTFDPEKYKLVPLEPTARMVNEGACAQSLPGPHYISESAALAAWRYMVKASPAIAHSSQEGWIPTDAELTAVYKKANNEENGKLQPISTKRIFTAMRAMLVAAAQRIPALVVRGHGLRMMDARSKNCVHTREDAVIAFNMGYIRGNLDTQEGVFTDIAVEEMGTAHADVIDLGLGVQHD